jgi:hypothetical protein
MPNDVFLMLLLTSAKKLSQQRDRLSFLEQERVQAKAGTTSSE